jgi:hypothetical protein
VLWRVSVYMLVRLAALPSQQLHRARVRSVYEHNARKESCVQVSNRSRLVKPLLILAVVLLLAYGVYRLLHGGIRSVHRGSRVLRERAVGVALSYVGTREYGENRGQLVERFQRTAGLEPGEPWCAAFVNFCAQQAANELRTQSPLENVPGQGSVPAYVNSLTKVSAERVRPGDLVAFWNEGKGRYTHLAFVTEMRSDRTFSTVDGNASNQVRTVQRRVGLGMQFLTW